MSETPAIRFSGIGKQFDKARVLDGLDLDIRTGEFFGLVGMNGAGKTTLIKCLLDFNAIDTGRIEILGKPHDAPHARAPLVYLPERFVPPYYLTGKDFLRYMLQLQSRPFNLQEASAMLDALDLNQSALTRPVRTYSKGMTQKLGLAACFLSSKDIYVLDEPMSGLDPKARALLKRHLDGLRRAERTVFFSSHALADVEELCDRMAILHGGKICFVGSPAECCKAFGAKSLSQAYLNCIQ
jgi:ABC-2 type transport system ATP-binding protein